MCTSDKALIVRLERDIEEMKKEIEDFIGKINYRKYEIERRERLIKELKGDETV